MNICPYCKQKENQFKILQADLQFEIKKRTEDLAQEKVTLRQHFQRQSKKMLEKYQRERDQRDDESKKWLQKYDVMVSEYEHRIAQLNATYQQKHSQMENQIKSQYLQEKQECSIKQREILQTIKNSHIQQIEEMKSQHLSQNRRMKKNQQDIVKKIQQQNQVQMKNLSSDYDSKIKSLKKELSEANDAHTKQKMEDHQKQTALYEDLYRRKEEINNLKYQIDQLEKEVKAGEEQLRFKVLQIEVLREQHQDRIETMKSDFQMQKEAIVVDLNKKMQNLIKDKLQDCQKFEQVVRDIDQKRNIEVKLYECSLKEVKELVDQRPSRDEDLEQIHLLRKLLDQKETEFQNILEEAKHCRLQLNNKQETFNRIFTTYASPLNMDKINKKKQLKLSRGGSALVKQPISKYNSVTTLHSIPSNCDSRKDKLVYSKSTKLF